MGFDTMCVHPGLLECKPETATDMIAEVLFKITCPDSATKLLACHQYRTKCVVDAMHSEQLQSFIKANKLEKLVTLVCDPEMMQAALKKRYTELSVRREN